MAGEFLVHFFEQRGSFEVKRNGEADVLCPFEHAKGLEKNASAHVNVDKGVFHCKTCRAEGRFSEGGLSEIAFIARFYRMPYYEAAQFLAAFTDSLNDDSESWEGAEAILHSEVDKLSWLAARGIDFDTVKRARLGSFNAGTIIYPVFINGMLLDKRQYNPTWREDGTPKIKSDTHASNLLFPYDLWDNEKPTLLCAGENDTLLAIKWGFNALTTTFGEGNFPTMFLPQFSGHDVYICYDADEAGERGGNSVALDLYEYGAIVHIVHLQPVLSSGKDITDLYNICDGDDEHAKSLLQQCVRDSILFDGEAYQTAKDEKYPLVDLWNVHHAEWKGRYISSRVQMGGKYDKQMETPVAVEWECAHPVPDSKVCERCDKGGKHGWWTIEKNPRQLLELVDNGVDDKAQRTAIQKFVGIPTKCPGNARMTTRAVQHVSKVVFLPDAETEDELSGFRMVEHYGYVLGYDLEDGQRYRIYMRRYPHPRDGQAIVSVVDRVEESDNAINRFKMTPEMLEQLSQFQGHPDTVMQARYELAQQIVGPFAPRPVVEAINLMYHSALDFKYAGKTMKGHPEGLIIGESRSGKSDTMKRLKSFYGIGNVTECKGATTAGLLGGADKAAYGGHRIKWGVIPRNHRGLLALDELSGMPTGVMASLTALRSERVARIVKIESGVAPAKVRLLWISNPRVQSDGKSRPIALYPNGISIVLDLIGSDEDVARFDFIVVLPPNESYISPFSDDGDMVEELAGMERNEAYRNLIHWVWSRRSDQIIWNKGVERYVWQVAQELNEKFDTYVKIFGPEAHKKLARIAVAVAALCFSHDGDGNCILVDKVHVDWGRDFLCRCYDNEIFRLAEYAEEQRTFSTTNEEVNNVFANLANSQPLLIKGLIGQADVSLNQLQIVSGLDRAQFGDAISNLVRFGLVTSTATNVMPTLRMKKALDAYRMNEDRQKLTPLSQRGVIRI